jgi:branched-chain amino acid aminotransferase
MPGELCTAPWRGYELSAMRLVSIDGRLLRPEEATVSVYDRGFLYGDSVFETIRTYAGQPFALPEHMARLARSAESVGIDLPLPLAEFGAEVGRAIEAAGNAESYARAMLTRGSGPVGLDPALAAAPLRVVLVEPLRPPPAEHYRDGLAVITVRTERAGDAAHGAKVGNYLASLLALRAAREAGAHEALIIDANGRVVEGTTSNLFIVERGVLITPPEDAAILAGITRARLLAIAAAEQIETRLEDLDVGRLHAADEAFLSSSIREVMPVVRVDDRTVGGGAPGPVTRRLHRAFRKAVRAPGPMPWDPPRVEGE